MAEGDRVIEIGPATENEVVLAFLRGEIESPRFGVLYKQCFDRLRSFGFNPQNLVENADLRSPRDNAQRIELLKAVRGYRANQALFTGFPNNVLWRRVGLEPADWDTVKYANYPTWVTLSGGTRIVADGAKNVDSVGGVRHGDTNPCDRNPHRPMDTFGAMMMTCKTALKRTCLHSVVLWGFLGFGLAQELPPIRSLPLPEARLSGPTDIPQGNMWMQWPADHQLGYVQGWLEGSYFAYFNACAEAQVAAPSVPDVQDKCLNHVPSARQTAEVYSARVTEFYSKYPQDRALPIRRLLRKLLEPDMTVDGVHKWLDQLIESAQHKKK